MEFEIKDSLLQFPCLFPIKIMGKKNDQFFLSIKEILTRHFGDLKEKDIKTSISKKGTYISITITVQVTSQNQLDNAYNELSAHKDVLVAL